MFEISATLIRATFAMKNISSWSVARSFCCFGFDSVDDDEIYVGKRSIDDYMTIRF